MINKEKKQCVPIHIAVDSIFCIWDIRTDTIGANVGQLGLGFSGVWSYLVYKTQRVRLHNGSIRKMKNKENIVSKKQ